ncbi:MAG: response regulator transcription factor [Candidatus Sericytochromatia bacterium]|nr:response regulator transcription factor [Candidatus Sericytochromatia bacterium]
MATIVVVEDEWAIRTGLVELLEGQGHRVVAAATGPDGLACATAPGARPDLVLLDVMLPGLNGFEVLKGIRSQAPGLPVIMVTAKGQEADRVAGFALEADDYVVKPFSPLELLGRIQAVLRRSQPAQPQPAEPTSLHIGIATVHFDRMELERDGQIQNVPVRALELLRCLWRHRGTVVSRDLLMDEVWGREAVRNTRTIDNYIVKLRQWIEPDPLVPATLHTVHGAGYRLDAPGAGSTAAD